MASYPLTTEKHYLESVNVFRKKSGEVEKNMEILQDHMPPLIQRIIPERQQLNILSVGSGDGELDMIILKIIKKELEKSEHGRHMDIFNRAIEPSEFSCGVYKAAIENLPSPLDDQRTVFRICQQTFEEYQKCKKDTMRFDIVHFIHSIYFFESEQTLHYCFEKELSDKGHFVCIVANGDLIYWVLLKQRKPWHGKNVASEAPEIETAEKLIQIANQNGWKHEVYTQEYPIDVTEVFDAQSTEGNLLLDFLTHTFNFRETADKQLVEETLALIKDLTYVKDGKRYGEKKSVYEVLSCDHSNEASSTALLKRG